MDQNVENFGVLSSLGTYLLKMSLRNLIQKGFSFLCSIMLIALTRGLGSKDHAPYVNIRLGLVGTEMAKKMHLTWFK